MKIKTSELEGAALDWAVADAIGLRSPESADLDGVWRRWSSPEFGDSEPFHPSTDWAQGGPLIDEMWVQVEPGKPWISRTDANMGVSHYSEAVGPTALVSAMRAIVAAMLGDEVEIPDQLMPTT